MQNEQEASGQEQTSQVASEASSSETQGEDVARRKAAIELIESIDRNLKKWRHWFPNEESEVEVPRCDLLALAHYARIGLEREPSNTRFADARALLREIVVTSGEDAGVILKSHESPTSYDPVHKAQVYKHEHFSELGDSLVKLSKLLDSYELEPRLREPIHAPTWLAERGFKVDGSDYVYKRAAQLDWMNRTLPATLHIYTITVRVDEHHLIESVSFSSGSERCLTTLRFPQPQSACAYREILALLDFVDACSSRWLCK